MDGTKVVFEGWTTPAMVEEVLLVPDGANAHIEDAEGCYSLTPTQFNACLKAGVETVFGPQKGPDGWIDRHRMDRMVGLALRDRAIKAGKAPQYLGDNGEVGDQRVTYWDLDGVRLSQDNGGCYPA